MKLSSCNLKNSGTFSVANKAFAMKYAECFKLVVEAEESDDDF